MFFNRETSWWKQLQLHREREEPNVLEWEDEWARERKGAGPVCFDPAPAPRHTFPESHERTTQPPSGVYFIIPHSSRYTLHRNCLMFLKSPLIKVTSKCDNIRTWIQFNVIKWPRRRSLCSRGRRYVISSPVRIWDRGFESCALDGWMSVFMLYVSRGPAMNRSPVEGVLPIVYTIHNFRG
jgi:hypothetical protein